MLSPHRKSRLDQRKSATKLGKFLTQCLCSTCFKPRGTECQDRVIQHFFARFKNWHCAANQVYFYKSNSKKSANLSARAAKFSFSKTRKDLKNQFFSTFANAFPFLQRTIIKKKILYLVLFNIFVRPPKWEKLCLLMVKAKTSLILVSLQFKLLNKTKEHILFHVQSCNL